MDEVAPNKEIRIKELCKLNPTKSTGIDGIKPKFLKDGAEVIKAIVKPLYKKNSRLEFQKSSKELYLCKELVKLSEESLMRQPEEVFDIICKLGEGSYGSVYKALHKESGQVLAIKQVPIDTDLQEIIKEISIMQQCDSPYVVKYYGSYFKDSDLWV
ncbi:unnamed protein product, partial [Meganyctiphanes norvegica]